MNIELSGKNKTVADGITVAELIAQEQLETPEHVKVAVNDDGTRTIRRYQIARRRCGRISDVYGWRMQITEKVRT